MGEANARGFGGEFWTGESSEIRDGDVAALGIPEDKC